MQPVGPTLLNPRLNLSRYLLQPSAAVGGRLETPARLTTDDNGPSSTLRRTGTFRWIEIDCTRIRCPS